MVAISRDPYAEKGEGTSLEGYETLHALQTTKSLIGRPTPRRRSLDSRVETRWISNGLVHRAPHHTYHFPARNRLHPGVPRDHRGGQKTQRERGAARWRDRRTRQRRDLALSAPAAARRKALRPRLLRV